MAPAPPRPQRTLILHTERLTLEVWDTRDWPDALRLWGDPEVMRWIEPPIASRAQAERTLRAALKAQRDDGVCLWRVSERATGRFVGACGFHVWDVDEEVEHVSGTFKTILGLLHGAETNDGRGFGFLELVYHLRPWAWGMGYAQEAAKACIAHAHAHNTRHVCIVAMTPEQHARSRRVLERVGMEDDGSRWRDERIYWHFTTQ